MLVILAFERDLKQEDWEVKACLSDRVGLYPKTHSREWGDQEE